MAADTCNPSIQQAERDKKFAKNLRPSKASQDCRARHCFKKKKKKFTNQAKLNLKIQCKYF